MQYWFLSYLKIKLMFNSYNMMCVCVCVLERETWLYSIFSEALIVAFFYVSHSNITVWLILKHQKKWKC